jgi:hypothetical protein
MFQSQGPREAQNNRDQKSHACAPLTVVRAAFNCFQKVSFPIVWFLMLYFKSENWN